MEPKVLHWKWYLQNSLEGTLVKYFKNTARLMKELAEMPLFPVPVELVPEKWNPFAKWSTDNKHHNCWFIDGSSVIKNGKVHWKTAA